jgi:ribosomal protein L19E
VDEFGYNNTGSPVSSTQFNEMYLSARQQWSNTERVNYIASLFSGETYHFTTTQTRQLILLVTSESDRLYLAKSAWDNLADPANYTQLFDLFNSTAARNEFSTFVNSNGSYTPTRTAMSSSEFNTLYNGVSNTWGLGAKQTKLTNIFNDANNIFTVAQVRQLISLVSSESNRVQLGKLAYNNVVDPENYTQLYDLLSTQAAKNELDAYVRQNAVGPVYGSNTAMSSDNFSRLYDDISNQWGIGAKYSSLTDAFNNSSYYFTTAQARMLIALVSSESNRLQLAKLSYDNITDRENFRNLYDLFSSQSSRSELDDYVKAYSYNH